MPLKVQIRHDLIFRITRFHFIYQNLLPVLPSICNSVIENKDLNFFPKYHWDDTTVLVVPEAFLDVRFPLFESLKSRVGWQS